MYIHIVVKEPDNYMKNTLVQHPTSQELDFLAIQLKRVCDKGTLITFHQAAIS